MQLYLILLTSVLILSGCVSSETTVTTRNSGAGNAPTEFDAQKAADTRVKLAIVHLRKNNMQQAKENLDMAAEYKPNDGKIYRIYAYYYQRVNEFELAEQYYQKSLRLDSKNPDTLHNYGAFLCKLGKYEQADKAFLKAIEQKNYTGTSNTYENAGICAEESGDIDKAIYYYQYALSHNPNKLYLNLSLAKIYIDRKDYQQAKRNLYNYQKKNKVSAESLWQWIRLSYATENGAGLNRYAAKLLEQFPDSQRALDYLNHEYY